MPMSGRLAPGEFSHSGSSSAGASNCQWRRVVERAEPEFLTRHRTSSSPCAIDDPEEREVKSARRRSHGRTRVEAVSRSARGSRAPRRRSRGRAATTNRPTLRSEWRDVQPFDARHQAVHVARQRPPMSEEVMRKQHRLRPLEMRVARQYMSLPHGRVQEDVLESMTSTRWRERTSRHSEGRWRSVVAAPSVWSLAPTSPASSVTRLSMRVTSSSSGANANEPVASSWPTTSSAPSSWSTSSGLTIP